MKILPKNFKMLSFIFVGLFLLVVLNEESIDAEGKLTGHNTETAHEGSSSEQKQNFMNQVENEIELQRPKDPELLKLNKKFQQGQADATRRMDDDGYPYGLLRTVDSWGYSNDDLIRFGLWYLTNPATDLDYEKAAWLLLDAFNRKRLKKSDSSANPLLTQELKLHAGQAAAIAARHYANKESKEFNLLKAEELHLLAANAGIQKSYLEAAYILKYRKPTAAEIKVGHDHRYLKVATKNVFKNGTLYCDDTEVINREFYPWTEELCSEAQAQHEIAKSDYDALPQIYFDRRALSRLSTLEAGVLLISGIASLGVAGAVLNPSEASNLNGFHEKYKIDEPDMNLGEMLLWVE